MKQQILLYLADFLGNAVNIQEFLAEWMPNP